jgi:hypothetical protein
MKQGLAPLFGRAAGGLKHPGQRPQAAQPLTTRGLRFYQNAPPAVLFQQEGLLQVFRIVAPHFNEKTGFFSH